MLNIIVTRASDTKYFEIHEVQESDFFNFVNNIMQTENHPVITEKFNNNYYDFPNVDKCTLEVKIYDYWIE